MFSNILVILILLCVLLKVNGYINNVTITDFSKCKVHYSRSESSYTKFYAINEAHRTNDSLLFDFHFSVLAPRDAHILLTPSPFAQNFDPVYEIVLGAGSNTFSDIRRLQKKATKSSKKTFDLLSSIDIKSFWIHFSKDGLLEIGIEGADIAFLSWKDTDPLPIQYFSFCTWGNVEAKWYYDCQREDGSTSDSQEVQKPLTPTEKLKNYLFTGYDPYVRPTYSQDDLIVVHLGFKQDHIHLDEMSSKLIVHGVMEMVWKNSQIFMIFTGTKFDPFIIFSIRFFCGQWLDEKINWNKDDYNNIEELTLHYRQIWQPDLYLYNSASGPSNNFAQTLRYTVTAEGWVTWLTRVKFEAWCDASGLGHWPQDTHTCELQLGFWTLDNYVMIQSALNGSALAQQYVSEWEVLAVESGHYLVPAFWDSDPNEYSSTFVIRYNLRRSSDVYTTVYFAPIVAISISLLMSFWVCPVGSYRISMYCFQLVLVSFILTKLGSSIPAHPTEIPYLVQVYSYSFIAILVALFFAILLKNWSSMKHTKPLPYFIYRFLSLNFVKTILYVQNSKFSESYNKLIEDNHSKVVDAQEMWTLLGLAVDRILFFVYFILIIVCLSKQY